MQTLYNLIISLLLIFVKFQKNVQIEVIKNPYNAIISIHPTLYKIILKTYQKAMHFYYSKIIDSLQK